MSDSFGTAQVGADTQPCPLRKAHWIEIELLDEDGGPVAGEPYRIRLTDGSVVSGTLDDRGRARFDGIPAGTCDVWFPELDGAAWEAPTAEGGGAAAALPVRPAGGRGWIEVRLVDDEGLAVEGERYELELPGGEVRRGITDAVGSIYLEDLAPGACRVAFPDLDASAWEPAGA